MHIWLEKGRVDRHEQGRTVSTPQHAALIDPKSDWSPVLQCFFGA